jgi:hypothetical protein
MDKIIHYFKKKFKRTDFSGLSFFGRGQSFDWKVLMIFFLLVMIVVISFSVHVFLGVRTGDMFKDDFVPVSHNETINRTVLDNVIKNFNDRAERLNSLQTKRPIFVDPSL